MSLETTFNLLLILHVVGGSVALVAGYGALMVTRGSSRHRTLGTVFAAGMTAVTLSGFPMSILHPNPFLFGIVVFSAYFVLAGWTSARYRKGEVLGIERLAAAVLLFSGAGALVYLLLVQSPGPDFSQTFWMTGLVFALIGLAIAVRDLAQLRGGPLAGKDRIIKHLVSMCAALIATTTAVAVTVLSAVPAVPSLALWLGPTLLLTPVIFYWAVQVRAGTFRY